MDLQQTECATRFPGLVDFCEKDRPKRGSVERAFIAAMTDLFLGKSYHYFQPANLFYYMSRSQWCRSTSSTEIRPSD